MIAFILRILLALRGPGSFDIHIYIFKPRKTLKHHLLFPILARVSLLATVCFRELTIIH